MSRNQNAVTDYNIQQNALQDDINNQNSVIKEIIIKRHNRRIKFGLTSKTFIVFLIGLLILFRYASITEINYKVNETTQKYNDLKNQNDRLGVDIAKSVNLQEIRRISEEKLGMQKPGSYQIIHISVPPIDQTELQNNDIRVMNGDKSWHEKFLNGIKQFFGII